MINTPYRRLEQPCCKQNCQEHFSDDYCNQRKVDLWKNDGHTTRSRKDDFFFQWTHVFVIGCRRNKARKTFVKNVFQVSNKWIYPKKKNTERSLRVDVKRVSVIAWFQYFKEVCDPMPHTKCEEYQVWQARKGDVYKLHLKSVKRFPQVYCHVCPSYFYDIWRKHCSMFKLRKFLRFHKCGTCTRLREVRNNFWNLNSE